MAQGDVASGQVSQVVQVTQITDQRNSSTPIAQLAAVFSPSPSTNLSAGVGVEGRQIQLSNRGGTSHTIPLQISNSAPNLHRSISLNSPNPQHSSTPSPGPNTNSPNSNNAITNRINLTGIQLHTGMQPGQGTFTLAPVTSSAAATPIGFHLARLTSAASSGSNGSVVSRSESVGSSLHL